MAALTLVGTITPSRQVTVTYSTDDAIGAGVAALIIDNTAGSFDVEKVIAGLVRSYHRQSSKASSVGGIATTGTTLE